MSAIVKIISNKFSQGFFQKSQWDAIWTWNFDKIGVAHIQVVQRIVSPAWNFLGWGSR